MTTVKDELAGYSRDHLIEVAKLLNPDGLPPEIQKEAQHAETTREEPG